MKKYNRLRDIVQMECRKANVGKKKREKRWKPMYELRELASSLGVSFRTTMSWYTNEYQPSGANEYRLPAYYRIRWEKFYYFK